MATSWTTRTKPNATTWDSRHDFLLQENGDFLLQESGFKFLIGKLYTRFTDWTNRTKP